MNDDAFDIPASLQRTDPQLMSDSRLTLRCPDHPNYQAVRKPKVNCATCHELYGMVNGPSK